MMTKYNVLVNNLLGYKYPFFLNNADLTSSHYLYEIYSPKLNEDYIPFISLKKISEKTKNEPYGQDSDILSVCLGSKKDIEETGVKFLEGLFKREEYDVRENGKDFPLITMPKDSNSAQKSTIIGLRDALRWKSYKFAAGRYVDILITQKNFAVFEIKGDKESIWLEPVAAYNNTDLNLEKPINIDWSRVDYPKQKFTGTVKASEMNRAIKRIEWDSFSKRGIK